LREYLQWIRGKAGVYLDVKTADLEKVVAMVRELGMEESVFFWFWNDRMARQFNRLAPDLTLKMAARSTEELRRAIEQFDAHMIECSLDKLTPEMMQLCADNEVRIMTKGGDNSPEHFLRVMQSGVQLVNLGRPDVYIETLRDALERNSVPEGF
jgi:glycerophosphoryl diester phosphodiesterase